MTTGSKHGDRGSRLLKSFNEAVGLHVAGRFAEAGRLYADLLRQMPKHPDVLDFYGTLHHQLGDNARAADLVGRSLTYRPLAAATRNRFGAILKALAQRGSAERAFRRAALIDPRLAEPAVNIATLRSEDGDPDIALTWCDRALVLQPGSFEARVRRGAVMNALLRFDEALRLLEPARRLQPQHPEIWLHLVTARSGTGDFDGALRAARTGIVQAPAAYELYAGLTSGRGPVLEGDGFVPWARRAVRLKPTDGRLWANLSSEQHRGSEPEAALEAARRAIVLDPARASAMHALVNAGFQCDRLALTRNACRRGLLAHPGNPDIGYVLAEVEFIIGDLRRAWGLHEARIERRVFRPRLAVPSPWLGPGTESGALLVASEQGVGDEVIFLSCLPDLLNAVKVPVVVEVDPRIVPVMARTFPNVTVVARQLVAGDSLGQYFDYAELTARHDLRHVVYAGSLPRFFRADRAAPSLTGGYLRPVPERVERWRSVLAQYGADKAVGVVWRSALMTRFRARHHADILDWAPVFRTPGCTFVNLMHGDVQAEIDRLKEAEGVDIQRLDGVDLWNDIDELLALLAAFDVVVAARTANCAFSAAVGTPTIRMAQSFNRISDGRDFFFANMRPALAKDEPFNARQAGVGGARILADFLAGRF
ncbi:tetratricopeptide repeat protein [Thalassobaculum sp.]|uniref:tetratricopeptide repeat protein n=1 Tax=Thalassobaculum sp. TaxID=2022740 RepID=UPI0032EEA463